MYINLHNHSRNSDGVYSSFELCRMLQMNGVTILSITDHNFSEDISELRRGFPDLQIVQGAEINAVYTDAVGKETEIHVVALGFDEQNAKIKAVLARNQPDRRQYVTAILNKLRAFGIDLGSYEGLKRRNPGKKYVGRSDIALLLKDRGIVSSKDEAFEKLIGKEGKAYVVPPIRYASIEEVVEAIVDANGAAVVAHPYLYPFTDAENRKFLEHFKGLAGKNGGIEVYYKDFTPEHEQCAELLALAEEFDLMASAGTDFHSKEDMLCNAVPTDACTKLLDFLGIKK